MAPEIFPLTIKELNIKVEKIKIGLEPQLAFAESKIQPELKVDE